MNGISGPRGEDSATHPSFLLVSGAPGSGKTTIARSIAEVLRYPLLSKDTIKESLFDSLGPAMSSPQQTPALVSRLLSDAAMDILWSLALHCPQAILEANFRPKSEYQRNRVEALPGRKLEIYCFCTPQEAARRFAERATRPAHHAAHSLRTIAVELLEEYYQPIGLCPVIPVNTESYVNAQEIVRQIYQHWPDLQS